MGEKNEENLALEMFKELKANARRWFITSIILALALLGTNIAWLIHEGQYETIAQDETVYTQEADTQGDKSPIDQSIGE